MNFEKDLKRVRNIYNLKGEVVGLRGFDSNAQYLNIDNVVVKAPLQYEPVYTNKNIVLHKMAILPKVSKAMLEILDLNGVIIKKYDYFTPALDYSLKPIRSAVSHNGNIYLIGLIESDGEKKLLIRILDNKGKKVDDFQFSTENEKYINWHIAVNSLEDLYLAYTNSGGRWGQKDFFIKKLNRERGFELVHTEVCVSIINMAINEEGDIAFLYERKDYFESPFEYFLKVIDAAGNIKLDKQLSEKYTAIYFKDKNEIKIHLTKIVDSEYIEKVIDIAID